MKSKIISRTKYVCNYLLETFLEWTEYLFNFFKRKKEWESNLTESYEIYRKHRHKLFVEDFLNERNKALSRNKYKMEIKEIEEDCDENTIGRVLLSRRRKVICQATLKTKESDYSDYKLIYWSFE